MEVAAQDKAKTCSLRHIFRC